MAAASLNDSIVSAPGTLFSATIESFKTARTRASDIWLVSARLDRDLASLRTALASVLGDRVEQSLSVRGQHAGGEGFGVVAPPDLVVYPITTEGDTRLANALVDG